ncbi:MAG: DNA polymerase III subunit delta [Bacteroidales bacterium]
MTFDQILTDLKNKIYRPIYLLAGEEPFYIDEIADYIENYTLTDDEKEFNQSVLYGKDVDVATIINYAKRFPMMANYQVIIVKEAQGIEKIEELNAYLENIQNSTILVLCYKYKKIDGRTSFKKNIEKKGIFFESKKLYDNEIPAWITNYLKKKQFQITADACKLLADFLGTDLQKIVNEITKLTINVPQNTIITPVIIEENIGISKDFNVFELQKALGNKEIVKANQIINYFAANPKDNPLVKILPILHNFFVKVLTYIELPDKSQKNAASVLGVNPFFVKDFDATSRKYNREHLHLIISLLREYDVKSKGVDNPSTSDGELMKELIYKILH